MNALLLLIATSAVGVDVGWLPLTDGGVEYIIQIEPELVDTLLKKNDLESSIPTGLDVRRFRVTVGKAKLPRDTGPAAASGAAGETRSGGPAGGAGASGAGGGANVPPATPPFPQQTPSGGAGPAGGGFDRKHRSTPGGSTTGGGPPSAEGASAGSAIAEGAIAGGTRARQPEKSATAATTVPGGLSGASALAAADPAARTASDLAAGSAGAALAEGGPSLGSATPNAFAKNARDTVSKALDDPRAPGRPAGMDTIQPALTAEEMGAPGRLGDTAGSPLANRLAAGYEANRPREFDRDRGGASGGSPFSNSANNFTGGASDTNSGRGFNTNPNERASGGGADSPDSARPAGARSTPAAEAEKPWSALVFTVALLLASVSANVYLGWVAWDSRLRYRELLAQSGDLPMPV